MKLRRKRIHRSLINEAQNKLTEKMNFYFKMAVTIFLCISFLPLFSYKIHVELVDPIHTKCYFSNTSMRTTE